MEILVRELATYEKVADNSHDLKGNVSFASGDLVQLRSGSPAMTVRKVNVYNATCDYYDNELKKFVSGKFYLSTLKKVDE